MFRSTITVLGSWAGVRRPFHISLFLTAPRVVLPQDPSTGRNGLARAVGEVLVRGGVATAVEVHGRPPGVGREAEPAYKTNNPPTHHTANSAASQCGAQRGMVYRYGRF